MKSLWKKAVRLSRFYMVMGTVFVLLPTSALANVTLIQSFLNNLQSEVVRDLNFKADLVLSLLECSNDLSCDSPQAFEEKFKEYRVYVGLLQYHDLHRRVFSSGHGYIVHQGLRLYYTRLNEEGKKEWSLIQLLHQADEQEILRKLTMAGLTRENREYFLLEQQLHQGRHSHYAAAVSEFLAEYPFFINNKSQTLTRKELARALTITGQEYELAAERVSQLKDDERFDLLGFTDSVEKVVARFNEQESRMVVHYIEGLNKKTKLWGRILDIITNWKTLSLATCHVATFAFSVAPNPVVQVARLGLGAVCTSIGVSLSLYYFGKSTKDIIRQMQYLNTGSYSREVFNQYLRSYFVTSMMAFLYVIPALPALKGRIEGIQKFSALSARAYRMKRLGFQRHTMTRFDKNIFISDMKGLGRRYAEYYGEELAISSVVVAGGRHIANIRSIEGAILRALQHSMQRERRVFTYGDLLKTFS